MRTVWVLTVKEVKALFSSWIAYVVLIAFSLVSGVSFYFSMRMFMILTRYADSIEEGVKRQSWNLLANLIAPLYDVVFILLFLLVPSITMRLFAEEKKLRTEELLLTSPIRVSEIVLAKYLAAVVLISLMLVSFAIYPALVLHYGQPTPDWGPIVTGFLGLFLMAFSLAAIGVFASSVTENQIVAFVFTVAIEMFLLIVSQASVAVGAVKISRLTVNLSWLLRAFSVNDHFMPMLTGVIKLSDLVYFAALIFFWLWATRQSIESSRWG